MRIILKRTRCSQQYQGKTKVRTPKKTPMHKMEETQNLYPAQKNYLSPSLTYFPPHSNLYVYKILKIRVLQGWLFFGGIVLFFHYFYVGIPLPPKVGLWDSHQNKNIYLFDLHCEKYIVELCRASRKIIYFFPVVVLF